MGPPHNRCPDAATPAHAGSCSIRCVELTPLESRRAKWVALVMVMALSAGVWWVLSRGVRDLAAEIAGPTGASHLVQALRVGFGLLLAWLPLRIALDIRSPYVALSLSPAVARCGAPARIEWRLLGRKARVSSLRMWLDGKAGGEGQPKMKSDEDLFHRQLVLDVSGEAVTATGQVQVSIPDRQQSWPPADRAYWTVRVELHAPPLPKVVSGYNIEIQWT